MADGEGIKIKIGADIVEVKRSLSQLEDKLKAFQEGLKTATAPDSVARLNRALEQTKAQIAGLKAFKGASDSLSRIKPGADQASQSILNLSRVAQDAPFAFNNFGAIANNLDPLFESFRRLRAETGSAKGAIAALGSSLIGGAGIGLAISVVTSLITAFSMGMFDAKDKTDGLAESAQKYADAQRSTAETIQKQVIEVESLVRIATSDIATKGEQADALTRLNEIIPDNIGQLTALNIRTTEGIAIVREYTRALEDQATADLLRGRAAELRVKLFDAENKKSAEVLKQNLLISQNMKRLDASDHVSAQTRASEAFATQQQRVAQSILESRTAIKEANDEFAKASGDMQIELANLRGEIDRNTKGGLKIEIKDPTVKKLKKVKVQVEEIELDPAKVGIIGGQFSKGIDGMADVSQKINTALAAAFIPLQTSVSAPAIDEAKIKLMQLEETASRVGSIVMSTLAPAFQQVFETIISGGGSALQAFGQAIKQLVAKIASAMITAAAFAAILNLIFPGSGLAAGGFSGAFKSIFSQLAGLPKFAKGGIATKPTMGIFGEKGKEAIIPLKQLPGLMASMIPTNNSSGGNFSVSHSIRGQELLLLINRAQNQWGTSSR